MIELDAQADTRKLQIKLRPANVAEPAAPEPEEADCAICLCDPVKPVVLGCAHVFCLACIEQLRSRALMDPSANDSCPLCRAAVGDDVQKRFLQGAMEFVRLEMLDPDDPDSWRGQESGPGAELAQSARGHLEAVLTDSPSHLPSLITLGEFLAPDEPERAEDMLRRAMEADGNEATAHLAYGRSKEAQGDMGNALAAYERASSCTGVHPNTYAAAQMSQAMILEDEGDLDTAVQCYKRAEKAMPDDAVVPFNLGVALEANHVELAIEAMERSIRLDDEFYDPYFALAASFEGGLYRRRIIAHEGESPGMTAQLWISAAMTALSLAPTEEDEEKCKEGLEAAKRSFKGNWKNVRDNANGCDSFIKWLDAHKSLMAGRLCVALEVPGKDISGLSLADDDDDDEPGPGG